MIWLNASLAFALAMIIFCTMVTAVTEAVHHFFNMRQRGLERMLEQLFEKVIWPRVSPSVTAAKETIKREFLTTLTSNPAVEQHEGRLSGLRLWFAPRQLSSLTLTQFAERFADTDLGKELWSSGRPYATQVVDDVARRFKNFEQGATAYFGQRAQMVSLMIAILLAFALNVHAIRLFTAFLTDQQLTARVLAQADSINATYREQRAAAPPPVEAAAAAKPDGQQPAADDPPTSNAAPATGNSTAGAANEADVEALREKIAFMNDQLAVSTALGLPIGNAYYPWCLDAAPGPICKDRLTWKRLGEASITPQSVGRFLSWFVSVLLAGVLIGLGGPFWFSAFSNLSAFVRLLGVPDKQTKAEVKDSTATAQPPTVEAPRPQTAGEAFAAMAEATAPRSAQGRILLAPHGTPL